MELFERFVRGDSEAFETLFRDHGERVYGWVLRIVRDRNAAEDITVEAFWRMYRARARFDPSRDFAPWARRIATNLALTHLRSRPREVPLPDDFADDDPPDSAAQAELRDKVRASLARLPAPLRAVALLALVEDRPYREIAEGLGVTENAVKLRVFRARFSCSWLCTTCSGSTWCAS